ncbi:MAG: pilus assembly protein FimV, partial [Herbaspirillum sp.]
MHLNTPAKRPVHSLKALAAAVASAMVMLSGSVAAAGLGQLTVLSSLGQPLRAEIAMTSVSKDEMSGLTAKLAPVAAYRQANIEFVPALNSLRFAIEHRASGSVIRVTSTQPINEPFVDMLLELNSSKSH